MTRLAKRPIQLSKGVEVKCSEGTIEVKGPKGTLKSTFPNAIKVKVDDSQLIVELDESLKLDYPKFGLYRALINNLVIGVSTGYEKKLKLIGVGYRAFLKGDTLELQLGFSHPCMLDIPEGITIKVDKSTDVTVSGIDKQLVGQFSANIRALRPPEPYKGKGVRYEDEFVRKKAGKAAKGK